MENLNDQKPFNTNDEMLMQLKTLKANPAYRYICENIGHWKNQCLNEILKQDKADKQKGEFEAYGRVLNAPDFFIQQLSQNPGIGPNLDPHSPSNK